MAVSLFLLMDPIGNIPVFISVLKDISPARQRKIIFRELIIALFIIILFYFLGEYLLLLLKVKEYTVMIAGGIILFIIAINMIFPSHIKETNEYNALKEPLIVPLAVPLVAGPAVLAAVMIYSHQPIPGVIALVAIVSAWILSMFILLAASGIKKLLGLRGIIALERLMGLLLTLIAIQMFLEGLQSYTKTI